MRDRDPDMLVDEDCSLGARLLALEQDRGRLFNEAEYGQLRRALLQELAGRPRCRPITIFTFLVVSLLLVGAMGLGIAYWLDHWTGGLVLALSAAVCLVGWFVLAGAFVRELRGQARRTLQDRLGELEQLRAWRLISQAEYESLQASILISR